MQVWYSDGYYILILHPQAQFLATTIAVTTLNTMTCTFFRLERSQLHFPNGGAQDQVRPDLGEVGLEQEAGRRPLQRRVDGPNVLRGRISFLQSIKFVINWSRDAGFLLNLCFLLIWNKTG